jgi:ABC-type Na+ transport system ATPase subunit NatA
MVPAITVDRLANRYGCTVAVPDVTFHVVRGEIFGLPGRHTAEDRLLAGEGH